MESRWQHGKMWRSHLPTTRVPARCWWGTSMPKEKGGTPKRTGRMWGDWRGRRSEVRTGPEPLRDFYEWRDPWGLRSGRARRAFLLPNRPGKSARLAGWVLCPQRPLPGRTGPGSREEQERQVGGALQDQRSGRGAECICPTHSGPKSQLDSQVGSPTLWDQRQAWAHSVPLSLSPTPHTPQGLF